MATNIDISQPDHKSKHLTVLSFGAGQDSTYILYRIIRDAQYKSQFVNGDFIVVIMKSFS